MKKLTKKGTVFIGKDSKPYLAKMWGGEPWLFYWHVSREFVSLRKLNDYEVSKIPNNLTKKQQDLYINFNSK